jgi:hypothetical protein
MSHVTHEEPHDRSLASMRAAVKAHVTDVTEFLSNESVVVVNAVT